MMPESPVTIVLASRSPRRLELATAQGWNVQVVAPPDEAEASAPPRQAGEPLEAFVLRLARAKAEAVVAAGTPGLILACDTLSEVDGEALGKPADAGDARRMLEQLSGRHHRVVTGVCLWQRPEHDAPRLATAESTLAMELLTPEFLDWYLASGMWRGKAGACGFQDERLPLRLIAGSPSNVVGLPIELVTDMLRPKTSPP
ncbi:MAG: Maf family protein [Planctomycetia bacterium]